MSHLKRIQETFGKASLSNEEIRRYSRHLIMPEVTIEGQKKLKSARVLAIGTGGLGSPLLSYLAAAGVGHLGIVDFDVVDFSNLQRQIIHGSSSIGKPKVLSAQERIHEINPYVSVETYEMALRSDNAMDLFREYDVIIDGTDNFPTRYLVNDACVLLDKPNVYGSIFRFEGQLTLFWGSHGPCYRCVYPEPPPPGLVPSCAEGGVLGILPGIIGVQQATETLKLILGIGDSMIGRLLLFDALKMKFRELKLRKNPECPICGANPTICEPIDYEHFCGMPAIEGPTEVFEDPSIPEMAPQELHQRLQSHPCPLLIDVREPHEAQICKLQNSMLVPMSELPSRIHEFDSANEMVVYCKIGTRSVHAAHLFHQAGFKKVSHLQGGIDAWARQVDMSMPRY